MNDCSSEVWISDAGCDGGMPLPRRTWTVRRAVAVGIVLLTSMIGRSDVSVDFSEGKWDPGNWIVVKNRRWNYTGCFDQRSDHIVNHTPDVSDAELKAKYFRDVAANLVYDCQLNDGAVISSTLSFDDEMAPMIVLAPRLGKDEAGRCVFDDFYQVVLFDKGVNVWAYHYSDGEVKWQLASFARFPLKKHERYNLQVKVDNVKGVRQVEIRVDGHSFGFQDRKFTGPFLAGVAGCEGRTRFYDFKIRRSTNRLLVLHLDFNTIQMSRETVVNCLRTASKAGYNAVLWEIENKVRWDCCPECVHPEAFSKEEFKDILREASRLGLAPIPLMQTFGHAEYILMGGKHPGWVEDADFPACYCVSNPEVRAFQKRLLHEYLELFGPEVKDFHLGGDEAIVFGTCPKCRTKDKFGLYASHLSFVAEELRERRVRPGIWCDRMLNQTNRADMAKIPRDFTLWNWNYAFGTDGAKPGREAKVGLLKEMGYEMIFGCTSQSVMDSTFLPLYGRHRQNITASADLVRKEALRGLCMTSWSVHLFPKALQYPLWDFAARRLLNPSADPLDDYMAAVRCGFGDVSAETLDRLSQWSMDFMQFDSRITKGYLKPAQPAKPGRLDEILSHLKDPGSRAEFIRTLDNVHAEVRAGRNELDAVAVAKPEMALLKSAADRVLCNLGSIRAIVEGWPVRDDRDESIRFYASEQTPLSARNSSALVWSIMAQSALFGKGK